MKEEEGKEEEGKRKRRRSGQHDTNLGCTYWRSSHFFLLICSEFLSQEQWLDPFLPGSFATDASLSTFQGTLSCSTISRCS